MAKELYLTKSRFKIGCECPRKLAYNDDKSYGNAKSNDEFLKALADGGFQVGELVKFYYPGGVEVTSKSHDEAVAQTDELLKRDKVTIFEAAIRHGDLFIRVDVLEKNGTKVMLKEVKAKSYEPEEFEDYPLTFMQKKATNKLLADWESYVLDITFQTHVTRLAHPQWTVSPYLVLVNKAVEATVDGLNQKFLIQRDVQDRRTVKVAEGLTGDQCGVNLMAEIPVSEQVERTMNHHFGSRRGFEATISQLVSLLGGQKRNPAPLSKECSSCEFRIDTNKFSPGTKVGFNECWSEVAKFAPTGTELAVIDLWNFRAKDKLLDDRKYKLAEVTREDIGTDDDSDREGLTNKERQWLQVEKATSKDDSPYIDHEGLASVMSRWTYPLHFIDFETNRVAIPMHSGRRPYEQIAFQFSHHIMEKDGSVRHADEYIHFERGVFPNYDFVRALRKSLSADNGTIFCYANHEIATLSEIRQQLLDDKSKPADAKELIAWIESVTKKKDKKKVLWEGKRCMVDLKILAQHFHYDPATRGSISLKAVLPAIVRRSKFLQEKYGKPTYGAPGGMPSLNFKNEAWITPEKDGSFRDPYKLLKKIFPQGSLVEGMEEEAERIFQGDDLANGGAAMTAWAMMQFSEMSEQEREYIKSALLRYCELDTLAMVMLVEYWKHEIEIALRRVA